MKKPSKLAIWRLEAGLSRKELGEKLNVSTSLVACWETGRTRPKDSVMLLYAGILKKPMEKVNKAIEEVYASEEASINRKKQRDRKRDMYNKNPQKISEYGRK